MDKNIKIFIVNHDEQTSLIIEHYLTELTVPVEVKKIQFLSDSEYFLNNTDLNIFVVDVSDDTEKHVNKINEFEQKYPNCKFIISSYGLKPDNIVKFLRRSKKDFIEKPIARNQFLKIVNEIIEKKTSEQDFSGQGKIISIFSNKGGLGKTTFAVNLSKELANRNKYEKVVLVDFNMFLGDVTTFLDLTPQFDLNFIADKAAKNEDIEEFTTQYANSNLFVIADSPYRDFSENLSKDKIIKLFNLLRKKYKYIIVDGSSAITENMKNLFDFSDLIILVSEAKLPALRNCKKCLDLLSRFKVANKTEIILNRFSFTDECTIDDVEEVLQKRIYSVIPNDWLCVTDCINQGLTIGEVYPNTAIYDAYSELAEMVADRLCR